MGEQRDRLSVGVRRELWEAYRDEGGDDGREKAGLQRFRLVHETNIERDFRTHEYEDSLRIFGPITRHLVVLLLSLGKIHRPQFSGRIPIVLG